MHEPNTLTQKERVIAYVDGFNLYFGMVDAGYSYCKWLNLCHLVSGLLKANQQLVTV